MIEAVKEFIKKHKLDQKPVLVGFSGGADSTCLLHIIANILPKQNIIAAHINHGWRGAESDSEELFCKGFCAELEIGFESKKLDETVPKTEDSARNARYEFFKELVQKHDAAAVFTAHTRSDNAETMLYRLIKGTGPSGLCGIPEMRKDGAVSIVRPLLSFSRKDIEEYCKMNGIDSMFDSSNNDEKYARNLIRKRVLPEIKKINEHYEKNIENLSKTMISQELIINEYIYKIEKKITKNGVISTKKYSELSVDVKKRLIYNLLKTNHLDHDFKKINEIFQFIEANSESKSGKKQSITTGLWLFVSQSQICFINKEETGVGELTICSEGVFSFNGKTFVLRKFIGELENSFPKEIAPIAYVDLSSASFPLTLRYRREKDIIQPFGLPKTVKLKKYLVNKSVPNHLKHCIILVCKENEVLWATGVGLSEKLRVNSTPTHVLELR